VLGSSLLEKVALLWLSRERLLIVVRSAHFAIFALLSLIQVRKETLVLRCLSLLSSACIHFATEGWNFVKMLVSVR